MTTGPRNAPIHGSNLWLEHSWEELQSIMLLAEDDLSIPAAVLPPRSVRVTVTRPT